MWREWVIKQQDQRALQKMQQETRTKMLNLLKAVTEVGLGSAPPSHTPPRERNGTDSKVGDIVHATVYFYIHVVCQCYRNYEMGNLRSKRGSMNSFQNPFLEVALEHTTVQSVKGYSYGVKQENNSLMYDLSYLLLCLGRRVDLVHLHTEVVQRR